MLAMIEEKIEGEKNRAADKSHPEGNTQNTITSITCEFHHGEQCNRCESGDADDRENGDDCNGSSVEQFS